MTVTQNQPLVDHMSKLKRVVPFLLGAKWGDIYHSFLAAEMALSVPVAVGL